MPKFRHFHTKQSQRGGCFGHNSGTVAKQKALRSGEGCVCQVREGMSVSAAMQKASKGFSGVCGKSGKGW
jgi:hypothetical protein